MEMEFKGLFKPNPRGFGFVNTDTHGIYVHPRIAKRFFYFDILSGVAESNGDGKWSCVSAKLVEEGARRIAGTIRFENGAPMVVPEISALPELSIPGGAAHRSSGTMKVKRTTPKTHFVCRRMAFSPFRCRYLTLSITISG